MKEDAIILIKQRGNCYIPVNIFCHNCPLFGRGCLEGRKLDRRKYERIIKLFIEEYGKDELLEILL